MAGKNTTPNAGPTEQKAAAEKTEAAPNSNGFRFRSTVRNIVIKGNRFADFVFVARTKDVADQIRSSGEFGRRVFQDSA